MYRPPIHGTRSRAATHFAAAAVGILGVLSSAGCSGERDGAASEATQVEGAVEVALLPQVPDPEGGRTMRWSPYGQQLLLSPTEGGAGGALYTELTLGPVGTSPVGLRLEKAPGSAYFDRLFVDEDRDGEFEATELIETEVSESRNKFWSSFDAVIDIPVVLPKTGEEATNPYALSLWYVEDPRVEAEEEVLRFSRDGWMEGTVVLEGIDAVVMLTESAQDGVFGQGDAWALASVDSVADILTAGYSRPVDEHAWLFEKAYRVVEVHPSGRHMVLAPFDPGMTRAEEIAMNDDLAVDRNAPRSGRTVSFLHDFEAAEAQAEDEGKVLFVDFETTWCGPCKIMDEWVYTADAVVDASLSLVAVKVDGDERLDLKERFGVEGFPTMVLLNSHGEELRRASGYVNVADMTAFLGTGG